MLTWRRYDYKTLADIRRDIDELGVTLPLSEDFSVLAQPLEIYGKRVKNRLCTQPMEGFDGFFDGTPSDCTFRKYRNFARGGVGLIWMESIAVNHYSKTCPRQLELNADTLPVFQRLIYDIHANAADGEPPFVVCQLTFPGRGAFLDTGAMNTHPIPKYIACDNPYLPVGDAHIITDDEIESVVEDYVRGAHCAKAAGYDAVDVRACHGYFLNEILSAFTRENSRYGGSFENRTRMVLEIVDRINAEVGIPIVSRLNACDLIPYPYGWGMKKDGSMEIDLEEPLKLAGMLIERGVKVLNISLGRNHVGHIQGPGNVTDLYPKEHQLTSVAFFQDMAAAFKKAYPEEIIMTGNFAWPRQFSAHIAAGGIAAGRYDLAGFARMALANPNFADDILKRGGLDDAKGCVGCGRCGALCASTKVLGYPVGCPTRFPEIFMPYYKSWAAYVPAVPDPVPPETVYPMKLFDFTREPPKP